MCARYDEHYQLSISTSQRPAFGAFGGDFSGSTLEVFYGKNQSWLLVELSIGTGCG